MKTDFEPKMKILLEPKPFEEAAAFLRDKPAVLQGTFARMIPEVRARAFTVSGIESANALREVRELIAELPQGARWDDVKGGIAGQLTWLDDEAADKRAELILRANGYIAAAAASYRALEDQRDVFPALRYNAFEDSRTRPEHAALDGLTLPANDPFWKDHYPPWAWGCRCWVTGATEDDVAAAKAGRGGAWMPSAAAMKRYADEGQLSLPGGRTIDARSPRRKAQETGKDPNAEWQWNPGDLRIPLESLRERYTAEEWAAFQSAMLSGWVERPESRERVWDWLLAPSLEQARARALAFGAATGREMAVLVDHATGAIRDSVEGDLRGRPLRVNLTAALSDARRGGARVVVVHNHPSGETFSPRDLIALIANRDVVEQVEAHSQWFRRIVRAGPKNDKPERLLDALKEFDALDQARKLNVDRWRAWLTRMNNNGVLFYEERTGF